MGDKKLTVLITGAGGFIGKNLAVFLRQRSYTVIPFELGDAPSQLEAHVKVADCIVHLAGINRPKDTNEFREGNVDFTEQMLKALYSQKRSTPVIFSSSIQASLDNPYGQSKKEAE